MAPNEHNRLVGIFLMAHGGLQAFVMLILCVVYGIIGAAIMGGGRGDERMVGIVFVFMVVFLAIFAVLFAGSQILGGYKMYKERANARTFGIIGAIVLCLLFRSATAAGVYGLWFLFGEEGKRFYLGGAREQPVFQNVQPTFENSPPPPPNSWQ